MSEKERPLVICWFRQDLRVGDNLALRNAAQQSRVLPIFILDDKSAGSLRKGAASRWWLHHSLADLNKSLDGKLNLYVGDAAEIIPTIVKQHQAAGVYWNRCYEPWRVERDSKIKAALINQGIEAKSFNGSLLWEPNQIAKKDGTPYRVFTPFYKRGCLHAEPPREPLPAPDTLAIAAKDSAAVGLEELNLLPKIGWDKQLEPHWQIGEEGAKQALDRFLEDGLTNYKQGRNFPSLQSTSRLSPHLHWGEISPHQIWYETCQAEPSENLDHFCSELGWREFSYSLLFHFPTLPQENFQKKFDRFKWQKNDRLLTAWQKGQTGYPLVDAGMRELWQTGYMHNRVRMVVGSFLVKNLLLDWRDGAAWFWDTLVDADEANNSASWQWVAGCGADAAPYFRIFNPITQGEKFDAEGEYTRKWVPELAQLPKKYLYKPWEAPPLVLLEAGVTLGETYPEPLVDVKESREKALAAFKELKT